MTMTRRDYVAMADVLARAKALANAHGVESSRFAQAAIVDYVSRRLADVLAADNPRFDVQRFLTAADYLPKDK